MTRHERWIHTYRAVLWLAALAILAGLLVGCSSAQEVRTETVPVLVAVPVPPPDVQMPQRPSLPLARVDSTYAPADVMRAYAASVVLLQGYARQLERLLRPYAPIPTRDD